MADEFKNWPKTLGPAGIQPTRPGNGPTPKNPSCGCSYCKGNALVVPLNHKPLGGASKPNSQPVAVFSPAPNSKMVIGISYAVTGFQMKQETEYVPTTPPPPVNETVEVDGWAYFKAPEQVQ